MQLTNHHKAYIGVLGVALGALAVDRLLLTETELGPASAHADVPPAGAPAPRPQAASPVAALPSLQGTAESRPRLATRLDALKSSLPSENISLFADTPWLAPTDKLSPTAGIPDPALAAASAPPPAIAGPLPQLTSVLVAGDRSCVIVDGQTLRVGDTHNDMRLQSVEPGAAIFDRNGELVRVLVQLK
jgi:hypothetical protein